MLNWWEIKYDVNSVAIGWVLLNFLLFIICLITAIRKLVIHYSEFRSDEFDDALISFFDEEFDFDNDSDIFCENFEIIYFWDFLDFEEIIVDCTIQSKIDLINQIILNQKTTEKLFSDLLEKYKITLINTISRLKYEFFKSVLVLAKKDLELKPAELNTLLIRLFMGKI